MPLNKQLTQVGLPTAAHWFACFTRSRHEKRVDALLRKRGIGSYLPVVPVVRQWKDRKKTVEWPLFPSYVFGHFSLPQVHDVLLIPGVSTIVRANGRPTPIPDSELQNVRRFVEAAARTGVVPEVRPLIVEGDWVRVMDGPFIGVEGRVLERRGRRRMLVSVAAIGHSLEVDIAAALLELIPGRA